MESNPIVRGVKDTFGTIPPVTRCLLALIIAIFIGQQLSWIKDDWVCFGGFWQTYKMKNYDSNGNKISGSSNPLNNAVVVPPYSWADAFISFFLSSFAHLGFLHIIMNSLVLVMEGGRLEKSIERSNTSYYSSNQNQNNNQGNGGGGTSIVNGIIVSTVSHPSTNNGGGGASSSSYYSLPSASATFLALTILLTLLTNTSMAIMHILPFTQVNLANSCVLGLSGVLFGYFAYGCYTAPQGSQMLFCGVNIPALAFPWVMLLFTFLMMPSTSFSGHFFGVVWGIAFAKVPILNSFMRRFGRVFGRGAVICPSFMTCGGTSRGSSPAASVVSYFHNNNNNNNNTNNTAVNMNSGGGRTLGTAATNASAPTAASFQMGRSAHPDISGAEWGPNYGAAAQPQQPPPPPPPPSTTIVNMGDVMMEVRNPNHHNPTSSAAMAHPPPVNPDFANHNNNVVTGIPIAMNNQSSNNNNTFRPFQGEGRKLGGN